MLKKIMLLIIIISTSFILSAKRFVSDSLLDTTAIEHENLSTSIPDGKVDIEITRDGTTVKIDNYSTYVLTHVVVEYSYNDIEDNILSSQIKLIDVDRNTFKVESNWIAIKVHQVKTLINGVYYTYAVNITGKESAPNNYNWNPNVIRKVAFVELKQVDLKKIDVEGKYLFKGQIYEVYFQFDNPHDQLKSITVDYIKVKKLYWPYPDERTNETEQLVWNFASNDRWELGSEVERLVANNDTSIKANYIGRFFPHISNSSPSYSVENVKIITIEYTLNGEHILADVVTEPISPVDDISWLLELIRIIKGIINSITNFFNSYGSTVLKVIVIIIGIILYVILSPFIKIIWGVIKLAFKAVISVLAKILGVFF